MHGIDEVVDGAEKDEKCVWVGGAPDRTVAIMKFGGAAKYASRITSIIIAETGRDMDVGSISLSPPPAPLSLFPSFTRFGSSHLQLLHRRPPQS